MSKYSEHVRAGESRTNLYDEITAKIVGQLEARRVPWVQSWGTAAAKVPLVYADRLIPDDEHKRAAETGENAQAIPFLKRFTVFNTDQCNGLLNEIARANICCRPLASRCGRDPSAEKSAAGATPTRKKLCTKFYRGAFELHNKLSTVATNES
jgi:antirestriction protein ArdC